MSLDQCHHQVVNALHKEGWVVDTTSPRVYTPERTVYIDIRAKTTNGRTTSILLVEVKCFPDPNDTTREVYAALGQYLIYREMLALTNQTADLYLAIPDTIYKMVFDRVVRQTINRNKIRLMIVNLADEEIIEWVEPI